MIPISREIQLKTIRWLLERHSEEEVLSRFEGETKSHIESLIMESQIVPAVACIPTTPKDQVRHLRRMLRRYTPEQIMAKFADCEQEVRDRVQKYLEQAKAEENEDLQPTGSDQLGSDTSGPEA
jgi:hypothetical protein